MRKKKLLVRDLLLHILLIFLSAVVLLPIAFMLFGSFKTVDEVFAYPPKLLPSSLYLGNYVEAWRAAPFGRFLFNSIVVATATAIGEVVFATMAAYALSHIKPWGSPVIFGVLLSGTMIPGTVAIVPKFFIINRLGWMNSYLALIVPFLARPLGVFLLYQFFRTLPKELEEAAKLDGCGPLRFMLQILVPLSRAPMGALAILSFIHSWNRYLWPLIVTTRTSMQTAPIGISMFINQTEGSMFGVMMAGAVIVIFPAIIAFILAQKQFVKALAGSSIKG